MNAFVFRNVLSLKNRRSYLSFSIPNIDDINPLYVAASLLPIAAVSNIAVYWRMQFVTAGMVGGIPKNSKVVELDAKDGKNIFYLGSGIEYTAVMSPGDNPDKAKEKSRINEQLILECIGKANREGLNLSGKVRTRSQEILSKSVDCVVTTGALSRARAPVELIQEAYRMLRPGGLLVFVEPDWGGQVVPNIAKIFPEQITGGLLAGQKPKAGADARESASLEGGQRTADKRKKPKKQKGISQLEALPSPSSSSSSSPSSPSTAPELVSTTLLEDAKDGTSSVATDTNDVDNEGTAVMVTDASSSGEVAGSNAASASGKARPGITSERLQNLFFPYVTGIAVRP